MPIKNKRYVGNAASRAAVWAFTPPVTKTSPTWTLSINGKKLTIVSDGTAAGAAQAMQQAWSSSQEPEFQEITASVPTANNPPNNPQGVGTNEIQALYITGTATGGSFQLSWGGDSTAFLADPTGTLTAAQSASTGVLSGTYQYFFTLLNTNPLGQVGETLPSPADSVTVAYQLSAPGAPTVAAGSAGGLTGTYHYEITFVNANGETNGGTESQSVTVSSQQINLTNIPLGGTGCTARKIYRTAAGGASGSEKYVATINDNTTTTYTDNLADGSLGAAVPTTNTTGGYAVALSSIPLGPAGTIGRRIYRTAAGGAIGTEKLVTTIWDNSTTGFTDNLSDASLGAAAPASNSTGIPYNATAQQMQTVLQLLPSLAGAGNVVVAGNGTLTYPWLVQWTNTEGAQQQALMIAEAWSFSYATTVPAQAQPQLIVAEIQQGVPANTIPPADGKTLLLTGNAGVPFYVGNPNAGTSQITGGGGSSGGSSVSGTVPASVKFDQKSITTPTISVQRTNAVSPAVFITDQGKTTPSIQITDGARTTPSVTITDGPRTTPSISVTRTTNGVTRIPEAQQLYLATLPALLAPTWGLGSPFTATATGAANSGNVAGPVKYVVTYTNSNGETNASAEITVTPNLTGQTGAQSQQVALTNIPIGPTGTLSRKIYRTNSLGISNSELLVTTINDNTTTTYTDNTADTSLGAAAPTINTTGTLPTGGSFTLSFPGVPVSPPTAPGLATATGTLTGTYLYVVTYVTALGETLPSPESAITLAAQGAAITLPIGPAPDIANPNGNTYPVIARKIYRTASNGLSGTEKLVTTINDNTTANYTDTLADGLLGAAVPMANTTNAATPNIPSPPGSPLLSFDWLTQTAGPGEPTLAIDSTQQLSPPGAPTVATGPAGNLTGTYYYKITLVNANGETSGGTASSSVAPSSQQINLSSIPTGAAGTTARKIYRTQANESTNYFLVATLNDNTTTTYTDNTPDGSLGAAIPTVNTTGGFLNGAYQYAATFVVNGQETTIGGVSSISPAYDRIDLSNIPTGPALTTARKIYRTKSGGSTFYLLTTLSDNTTTTYTDNVADGSLGAAAPTINGTASTLAGNYIWTVTFVNGSGETTAGTETPMLAVSDQRVILQNIPTGPTGTTARKIYRTAANTGSGTEKLVATLSDNTTTTFTDFVPDSALGAAVPTTNTAGISPPGAPTVAADTSQQLAAPGAPTVAVGASGGLTGNYLYKITFLNANGETNGGTESAQVSPSAQKVNLSSIPLGGTGCTGRNIYRTAAGGASGTEKYVATISDNTTTTYTDNLADGSLGAAIPIVNTTGGKLNGSYLYSVTFLNASGETKPGIDSASITINYERVDLSNIPLGPTGTTSRKLYRTVTGGAAGSEQFLATINDNTTTTYTDDTADASLGAAAPTLNTTGIPYNAIAATVQSALQALSTIGSGNMLVGGAGTQTNPWNLQFAGTLIGPQPLVGGNAAWVAGTDSAAVTEVRQGNPGPGEVQRVGFDYYGGIGPVFDESGDTGSVASVYSNSTFILVLPGPGNNMVAVPGIPYNATPTQMLAQIQAALGSLGTASNLYAITQIENGVLVQPSLPGYSSFYEWDWQITYKGVLSGIALPQAVTYPGSWVLTPSTAIPATWAAGAKTADGNYHTVPGVPNSYLLECSEEHGLPLSLTLSYGGAIAQFTSSGVVGTESGSQMASDLQTALAALSTVGNGNVTVTYDGGVGANNTTNQIHYFTVTFSGPALNVSNAISGSSYGFNAAIYQHDGENGVAVQIISISPGADIGVIEQDTSPTFKQTTSPSPLVLPSTLITTRGSSGAVSTGMWSTLVAGSPDPINEIQSFTLTAPNQGRVTGGTFILGFGGHNTAPLPYDASAAEVSAALQGLSSIGSGNVSVTGSAGVKYIVTFQGALGGVPQSLLTAVSTALWGDSIIATEEVQGVTGASEVDVVTITNGVGGSFLLGMNGGWSAAIAYNATAGQVQTALQNVSTIGSGNVSVSGSAGGPWTVTFVGSLAYLSVPGLSANGTQLDASLTDTITITSGIGGTFTLSFNGQTTANIAYNATAAAVQSALTALSTVRSGGAVVTGSAGGPWTVELLLPTGQMIGDISSNDNGLYASLTDTLTITNYVGGTFTLSFNGQTTAAISYQATAATIQVALNALANIGPSGAMVTGSGGFINTGGPWTIELTIPKSQMIGDLTADKTQLDYSLQDAIGIFSGAGGTFTLSFNGQTTVALPYNVTASAMQSALAALSTIGAGNVTVSQISTTYIVTITLPGSKLIGDITGNAAGLTGSITDTITIQNAEGGTFGLLYNGSETGTIAYNATANTVQTALAGLPTIGSGNVSVTGNGTKNSPYVATISLLPANLVGDISGDPNQLLGSATWVITLRNASAGTFQLAYFPDPYTVTMTGAPSGGTFTLTYGSQKTADLANNAKASDVQGALAALKNVGQGNVSVAGQGVVGASLVLNNATGGTFTLGYANTTTSPLNYNSTASQVQTALGGLSNVGSTNVAISGSGTSADPFIISLSGGLNPQLLAVNGIGLTPSPTATLTLTLLAPWIVNFTGSALVNGAPDTLIATSSLTPSSSTGITIVGSAPSASQITGSIAYNASASTLQTALSGLSDIGAGNVLVSGVNGGPWTAVLTLAEEWLNNDWLANVGQGFGTTGVSGGVGVSMTGTTTTITSYPIIYALADGPNFWDSPNNWADGAPPAAYLATPPAVQSVIPLATDATLNAGTQGSLSPNATYYYKITALNANGETTGGAEGSGSTFAGAKISIVGNPTGGNFTISYGGQTTANIVYGASAATVESALDLLSTIGNGADGNVTVTGSGTPASPYVVILAGTLANTVPTAFSAGNGSPGLSGPTSQIIVQNLIELTLAVSWNELPLATAGYKVYRGASTGNENVLLATITTPDQATFVDDGTYTTTAASPPTDANAWHNAVGDDVYFTNSSISCLYNIQHSAANGFSIHGSNGADPFNGLNYLSVNSFTADSTYTGMIGLFPVNTLGYEEYRPLQLSIVGPPSQNFPIAIGNGNGSGSPYINLDTGTSQVTMVVNKMASATSSGAALVWIGNNAASEIDLFYGTMAIAIYPGQTFALATIRQAYQTSESSDTSLEVGPGGTVPLLDKKGGSTLLHGNVTTLNGKNGTVTQDGGMVGSLDLENTTYIDKSVGAITTLKVTNGGVYDRSQDSRPKSIGSASLYAMSSYLDPHGATYNSTPGQLAITLVECGLQPDDPTGAYVDLGKNVTLLRTQN